MSLSTITGTSVLNWCSTHAELLPLTGVGGYANEPGLSIINDALGEIINDENDWKWNRVELDPTVAPLVTMTNKQDYLFAGASAFVLAANPTSGAAAVQSSGVGIDLTSNSAITVTAGVVTVKTLEAHRFLVGNTVYLTNSYFSTGTASKYNATYTDNGNQTAWGNGVVITAINVGGGNNFTFAALSGQNNADVGGAPGFGANGTTTIANSLSAMGWLTDSQMIELNNNSSPPNVRQLAARRHLTRWSKCADPERVCILQDLGTGILKIRFEYVPSSSIWAVGLIFQAAKPLVAALGAGTFAPIPDYLDFLIRQAVLYRCYRYLDPNSSATGNEYQKFKADVVRALGRDQAEESSVYLEPVDPLVDSSWPFYG